MSILPASRLSASELALLGNNLAPAGRRTGHVARRRHLAAVNRSLTAVGERVSRLYRPRPAAAVAT